MLNSIGVIIAACIIYVWPELWYVDPLCTYFFAIVVVYTTKDTFKQCLKLLLEATPDSISTEQVESTLLGIEGVEDVHDLHVWGLTQEKFCMTAHVTVKETHYLRQ